MRKIYTSLLLVVLFWGAGNAQDYVRLNHFPFAYNTDVEEIEFFNTSPFTTLFAKYKIKELHELYVFKGFNDSAQTVYYFNEKGETDSILIFYDFQHQKTKYWKYSLKYNENGKATRFEYTLFDSDTIVHDPALIFVEYEGNIPVRSIHIFNNCENKFDTVICQYYYFPEREYPWERLEIEYIIKDTCLSKDEYMNKCYQLPLYLFEKENQDSVLLTTDEYGSTLYFFNKNHKIISELVFSRWTEEPILENYMNYTWKFNGILESCISSMNKYGCNTDTFCMVAFNENNLPLVFESRIEKFNFKYIYDEKLYRWSDCNFGNKA
jgi:hypothetical protein